MIYNPQETRLLREAKEAGCRTGNGMYMLLYQGAASFKLWTGADMPVEVIKAKYFFREIRNGIDIISKRKTGMASEKGKTPAGAVPVFLCKNQEKLLEDFCKFM